MVVDGSAPHEHLVGIRRHVRRQGGRHQVHRRDALLPRLFLFRKGKAFRRRTLVRHPARFSRRVALQAPRLARTDPDQDARRHRLRHQQRRPDRIGCRPVPRQQVGGTGAQSAVLPLRGNLPQIPQPQPRRPRCELLPRSGCQGRPRNHRKGPLQALSDRTPRKGLPDALRPEGRRVPKSTFWLSSSTTRSARATTHRPIRCCRRRDGRASPASSSIPI